MHIHGFQSIKWLWMFGLKLTKLKITFYRYRLCLDKSLKRAFGNSNAHSRILKYKMKVDVWIEVDITKKKYFYFRSNNFFPSLIVHWILQLCIEFHTLANERIWYWYFRNKSTYELSQLTSKIIHTNGGKHFYADIQ